MNFNMDKIKVLQVGCGKMSKYTMRYVYEHGAVVVGAVDINKKIIGLDISQVIGCENKNIIIRDLADLDNVINYYNEFSKGFKKRNQNVC